MKRAVLLIVVVVALAQTYAGAEIADSTASGFTYKLALQIQAPPDTVYQRLLSMGDWWSSDHTFSGDAHNLSIDARPMGCWCEKLPNGGGVRHMQVVNVMPGKMLVMTGGVGPLQAMAATGSMSIRFSPANGGTTLDITYAVTGYFPGGTAGLTPAVESVLTTQFMRLKSYVETGKAEAGTAPKK